jgi:UDP-N-acetylmuramyl pentapeptide phosphotransferase/UDP-N-acetylglucosamine-1-phosphate transferase
MSNLFGDSILSVLILGFAVSFTVAFGVVRSSSWHVGWSGRGHARRAVQSVHAEPTPRIGGVAIFAGLAAMTMLMPPDDARVALMILTSALPIFAVGLIEDVGNNVSPNLRLLAAFFSGIVMMSLSGEWLRHVDLPGVDLVLAFAPLGILFTLFACGGVSHAFNLIDGMNGLAGFSAVVVALALAGIGYQVGDGVVVSFGITTAVACLGFLCLNFPGGKIFLGDAGAYTLGHVLSWTGILLIARNPDVTPWAILLIFFWPVMETLYSIFRRRINKMPADQPDKMHMHHLFFRSVKTIMRPDRDKRNANPVATIVLMPIAVVPALSAQYTWDNPMQSALVVVFMAAAYVVIYRVMVRLFLGRSLPGKV